MIYPKEFEEKIGFADVREQLSQLCYGVLGRQFVQKMSFQTKEDQLQKILAQTEEYRKLVNAAPNLPAPKYIALPEELKRAELEYSWLEAITFYHLRESLANMVEQVRFISSRGEDLFPQLKALVRSFALDAKIIPQIDYVVNDKGEVRDSASTELQRIRKALISERGYLRRRLTSILIQARESGMAPEDAELTIRSGRLVIPILAENKRKLKGFIHDESATGQTSFIEPAEVFEANNFIRELELEEHREVVKILTQLTNTIRPQLPEIRRGYQILGILDFLSAKYRLANEWQACVPELVQQPTVSFTKARHPLLQASLAKQQKAIVPIDVKIDEQNRLLVISGPNAGGKSIALKTVALLQYCFQCGLPIPVQEGSSTGVFEKLLIDIGDEQSLENDLSTYSSHLKHMSYFLKHAGPRTLIFIDEFGTGTEPQYGGAIAEAILEELNNRKAKGVVTTHFGNLKDLAGRTDGLQNAAMRYDAVNLKPLYELEIGKPGNSYALEIARNTGLPDYLVQRASKKVGGKRVKYDDALLELEKEKQEFQTLTSDLRLQLERAKRKEQDYQELKTLLDTRKTLILKQSKQEAQLLLQEANKKIENAIREIKESEANKEVTKQVRTEIDTLKADLKKEVEVANAQLAGVDLSAFEKAKNKITLPKEEILQLKREKVQLQQPKLPVIEKPLVIEEGAYVKLKDTGNVAQILGIVGKDAELRMGVLKTKVKVSRLEAISESEYKQRTGEEMETGYVSNTGISVSQKVMSFNSQLDLRGYRGEEALDELDRFMDDAFLTGSFDLRILHGKGDGILRKLVREKLRHFPQVANLKDEHADRGGSGVTIVELRY